MKPICQLYMPAFYRSYGKNALREAMSLLSDIRKAGFQGIYLIALWEDGGYDNGFDVVSYSIDPKFGEDICLGKFARTAHELGLTVGVDIVPNHVSDKHVLARNCLNGVFGYEDCLYVVSGREAKCLTEAGVPSFFGELAYSPFGDKYVRTSFADFHQLNLNWESEAVKRYFNDLFWRLKFSNVDFVRVDCGMMLLEDVSKANKHDPMACMDPKKSIEAIRKVSGGMTMFFEWFDPKSATLFEEMPECYALDCSYVITEQQNLEWQHPKLIPLLGGHDQMTAADRGVNIEQAIEEMKKSEYAFLDFQTLIGWKTYPGLKPGDEKYDANLANPNQRYRARRPVDPARYWFQKDLQEHKLKYHF